MDLNDRQFQQYYVSRGVVPGRPVKRSILEGIWQEYQSAQSVDTASAQGMLSQLPEAPQAAATAPRTTESSQSLDLVSPSKKSIEDDFRDLPAVKTQPEEFEVSIDSPEWAQELARIEATEKGGARRAHYQAAGVDSVMSSLLGSREDFKSRADYEEYKNNIIKTVPGMGIVERLESRSGKLEELKQSIKDPQQMIRFEKLNRANPSADPVVLFERAITPTTNGTLGLAPEKVIEQVRSLQQARDAELQMADASGVDEVTLASSRQRAASLDQQIDEVLGVKDLPWADRWNQNRIAKLDAARMEEMKGGSVNYLGVPTSFENLPALRTQIGRDEINLKMEAEKNPSVLPINRKITAVVEQDLATGQSVLNEAKSKEKWASMEKQLFEEGKLRVGDLIQNPITGAVEVFPGLGKAETGKDKSLVERWSPGGMGKPVIRGAQELGDQVTKAVQPILTDENVDKAAAVADRFYPRGFVGPTLRGSAALMNDPARTVAPVASGVYNSLPLGFLASRGLDYLANIGRKAEEEDKKRQAGQ